MRDEIDALLPLCQAELEDDRMWKNPCVRRVSHNLRLQLYLLRKSGLGAGARFPFSEKYFFLFLKHARARK